MPQTLYDSVNKFQLATYNVILQHGSNYSLNALLVVLYQPNLDYKKVLIWIHLQMMIKMLSVEVVDSYCDMIF